MPRETTYSGILGELLRFQASMEASLSEIPHLGLSREILGESLTRAQALARRHASVSSERQQLTQQFKAVLSDSRRMATVLRKALQHHYGIRSEKMTEFGLRPYRGRKIESSPAPKETESPAAE
jgi:hypothetical protein